MANNVSVELSLNATGYQEGINGAIDSTKKYETEVRKEHLRNILSIFVTLLVLRGGID